MILETKSEQLVPETTAPESSRPSLLRRPRARLVAVIAVLAAVGLILGLTLGLSGGGGGSSSDNTQPLAVSATDLEELAGVSTDPIYWAGPMPGKTYEFSRGANGSVYVRYLPSGAKVGAKQGYLTIATYVVPDAFAATTRAADGKDAVRIPVGAGAVAFYTRAHPQSVYFAQRGSNAQVEVFAPSAADARRLVAVRKIVNVTESAGPPGTTARATTPAQLKVLSVSLKHPIYWVGPKTGFTYELSEDAKHQIFVRYLPKGVKVGTKQPYLTIGTYPFAKAYPAISALVKANPKLSLKLAHGGLAVIDVPYKRSIHIAYPGSRYQIELFDPSAAVARQLVASGQVQPVR